MMNIEVDGPGCPLCRKLYQGALKAVAENGIDVEAKRTTGLKTTMKYAPMAPLLLVEGKAVHRGKRKPGEEKIVGLPGREVRKQPQG
jgi:hypothetical protein